MKFHLLYVFAFILCSSILNGQEITTPPSNHSNCMTEEEHNSLLSEIERAMKKYQVHQPSKTTKSVVLFEWPLRAVSSLDFHNYYYVSNYVDHNPALGPNNVNQYSSTNLDYNCGNHTYDSSNGFNHQGTDISLWPFHWHLMENNLVEVIAAQSGTIIARADGHFDKNCGTILNGAAANYIILLHSDNSRSIYYHLKNGSLTSKPVNSQVAKGEYLGIVGSSGHSSAPHLHFEVRDAFNNLIDPYQGSCNSLNNNSWWKNQPGYKEPQINAILTHSAWPVLNQCPPNTEHLNRQSCHTNNEALNVAIYWRDMQVNLNTSIVVKDPNNNIFSTTHHSGTISAATYMWTFQLGNLPTGGPYGNWTIEATFNNQVYYSSFQYSALFPCSQCPNSITQTGNQAITQDASAHLNITTNGTIASGLSIDYQAGQKIDLSSGFRAVQGSVFRGSISSCQ